MPPKQAQERRREPPSTLEQRSPDTKRRTLRNVMTAQSEFRAISLIGRLTTNPELRGTHTQVRQLRLAIQRQRGKDSENRGSDFVDVTRFGIQADVCAKHLADGRRLAIERPLRHSAWETDNGAWRQKFEVVAATLSSLAARPARTSRWLRRRSRKSGGPTGVVTGQRG